MIRYYSKPVRHLTPDEYRACHGLNFREEGSMQEQLEHERTWPTKRVSDSKAIMAWEGDKLVGWILLFYLNTTRPKCYAYVRKSHRRRGIGRQLFARARMGRRYPLRVFPHDQASHALYARAQSAGRAISTWEI